VDAGREYDIIAIQEPWQNPHIATTYCPRGGRYHLAPLQKRIRPLYQSTATRVYDRLLNKIALIQSFVN
jgi:hypothetical protein